MMDLGVLMVPFFTGLAAFTLAVFNNVEAINIDAITVPASVSAKGYTPDILIRRLVDRMHEMELQAQSHVDAKQIVAQDDGGSAAALGQFFQLTPLLRVVQTSLGLIPFTLSGEIVTNSQGLEIVLRGTSSKGHETFIREQASANDIPGLIDKAAYEAMRMVDPTLLAAYQFKRDYLTRDFTLTEDVIRRALVTEEADSRKWVLNLWGIVRYQEGDFDGAIEKFQQALEMDPKFQSSLFNWGVVLIRQGKRDEAVQKFKQLVTNWHRGDPVDVLAAAETEWGFALALSGQTEQAFAKFRYASQIDPTFSDVYTSWAEVLSATGHVEEAEAMTNRAVQLSSSEVVYTDNLVGRIQDLPAVASSR